MSSTPLRRSKRIQESTPLKDKLYAKEDGEMISSETSSPEVEEYSPKKKNTSCSFSLMDAPTCLHSFLAKDPSKRDGEWFFLWYSVAWVLIFGCVVVSEIYKHVEDLGYLAIGLSVSVPCFLIPLLFPSKYDRNKPWRQRYVMKANVWIAIFGFIGNYFWTHYFFNLLGASYTFPIKYKLNLIPPVCYLLTHPYFLTYHSFSNLIVRKLQASKSLPLVKTAIGVAVVAVAWSYLETWSIQMVPYYSFVDRDRMYSIGTFFYALYFIVSFPMFFRIDEEKRSWTMSRSIVNSLASAMVVFVLCDFWRLIVGNILPDTAAKNIPYGVN